MNITKKKVSTHFALAVAGVFALSACGMDDAADMNPAPAAPEATEAPMETPDSDAMAMDAYSNLVGPECLAYDEAVPEGAGSVQGMSQDPVAVAASNNPLLTTLVAAVSGQLNPDVDLVDTLNGSEFTVFAPTDDAFAQIDDATIEALQTDADLLSAILTYHVVPGQIVPDNIAGTHTTVNGAELTVTGMGDDLWVNEASMVLCGGVQTANATVYLVDAVLLPPME